MWPTWLQSIGQRLAGRGAAALAAEQPFAGAAAARAAAAATAPDHLKQRARFEEMEPRLLYSADSPAAWLPSAVVQVVPSAQVQLVTPISSTPVQAAPVVQASRELVFIDAAVTPTPALIDGLRAARPDTVQLQVVVLQSGSDGLQQISQVLAHESGLSAVHIVAHGEQAALQLGSTRLDAAALAKRGAELQAWQYALTDSADLLLYSCDVAAGDTGAAFIQRLAVLTGADVAASTNATGAAAAGGDWVLEAQVGSVSNTLVPVQPLLQAMHGVLGLAPVGGEARVNTNATGAQTTAIFGGGNVAMDSSGNHVVVWNDARTNSGDVYFQRYDAAGVAQGANTLVNSTTANAQGEARVAMDANGNFVVVWTSSSQDGGGDGVYAQRYNASGVAQGGEFLVNTTTSNHQNQPTVAMNASGNFTIAWTSATGDGSSSGIFARRYNAGGAAQGGEFLVNTTTTSTQRYASVAMADSGAFVVAWESDQTVDWGVYAQRFDASGAPQGAEWFANSTVPGTQWNAAIAADAAGNFVIVWTSAAQDPDSSMGIYGQRYNASGVAQGGEFRINSTTANAQAFPAVAMNASGGFVVSWTSDLQDGSGLGIYAQAFEASGAQLGGELRVAATSSGAQQSPAVAYRGSQAVVAWNGNGTGDAEGVFVRQLQTSSTNQVVVDTSSDTADGDTSSITALYNSPGADGFISLREAITAANNTANGSGGADRIEFAIGLGDAGFTGTNGVDGRWVITLASALPAITDSVSIDASTQTTAVADSNPGTLGSGGTVGTDALALGTVNRPEVEVVGSSAVATAFNIAASDVTLRGFAIRGVGSAGSETAILVGNNTTGTLIEQNVLGTGAAAFADPGAGLRNWRHIVINGGDSGTVQNNLFGYSASNALEANNSVSNWLISNNELRDSGIEVNGADAISMGSATAFTVERNLVTGTSGQGVVAGTGSSGITVVNNTVSSSGIGTPGSAPSQTSAVAFRSTVSAVTVERNIIAASFGAGVAVNNGATGVTISRNSIYNSGTVTSRNGTTASGQIGIDLGAVGDEGFAGTAPYVTPNDAGDADAGANNLQNFPVLATARSNASNQLVLAGTLNSSANSWYRIEFFASTSPSASGFGEGQTYLGFANVATDGAGNAGISTTLAVNVAVGSFISATATQSNSSYNAFTDTSEFARNIAAVSSTQATVTVGTTADTSDGDTTNLSTLLANPGADGSISLREAITAANNTANGSGGADIIAFNIAGAGPHVITPGSALPAITQALVLDGSTEPDFAANGNRPVVVLDGNNLAASGLVLAAGSGGSTVRGLVVRDFGVDGISVQAGSNGNTIVGNFIGGLDTLGADAGAGEGNAGSGIRVQSDNNLIGGALPGQGNTVAFNTGAGVWVAAGNGVAVLRNSVYDNGGLGIDLGTAGLTSNDIGDADSGANGLQNFPVLTTANSAGGNTTVTGSFSSNAGTSYRIEFFSSPVGDAGGHGEGRVYLGSTTVSTNGGGLASIGTVLSGVVLTAGHVVSATATVDLGGGNYGATSEFAANVSATASATGITVGAISGNTSEAGASASFSVVLNTAPLADVQVPVLSSNGLEGSVSTALLTFTTLNWATPQVVTVFGEDDTLADGNRAYSVVLGAASSSDAAYSGLDAADVAVTNTDNDTVNTVFVTTAADAADGDTSSLYALLGNKGADGQISLREAMAAANNTANGSGGVDRIHFSISGTGVHTLNLASALPVVTGAVVIDGSTDDSFAANSNRPAIVLDGNDGAFDGLVLDATADGSTLKGLVVRDFGAAGIWVQPGSDNHSIVGNYIGALDSAGQWAAGEGTGLSALFIQGSGTTVGGSSAALRNVIAGATFSGIWMDTGAGNTVVGNYIGLAGDGSTVIGNGWSGITIGDGAGNRIGGTAAGEGNRIAGSGDDGIQVLTGTGNALLGNTITGSASLGIELGTNDGMPVANDPGDGDTGGNNLQNTPVLATARTDGSTQLVLTGSLDGAASTGYRIEFFANTAAHASGHGEGQRWLGFANVTTDGSGQATLNTSLAVAVAAGESISATATRTSAGFTVFSDTSEFALNVAATLAPVLSTSGTALATTENDPATPVDAALTVTDGDSANLSSATVTITGNYALGQDLLSFSNQLGISGSWNAGSGQLTLTGSASVASYQTALRSVSYSNSSDAPSTLARTVSFVVNDGVAPSAPATRSVTVAAVNDAPGVATTGSALVVAENDAATPVDAGLVVSDADSASLSGATVSFTANYVSGEDLLLFTNQLGISGSWNAGTGVLTLSGTASVANYQAALRTVSYLNNSEAPDAAVRTLAFDATDGALTSTAATRNLQVTPVNDAPVLDNTAAMQLSTISRTDNSNSGNTVAQVIGSVGGDRITDVDSAALEGVALTATSTAGLGAWQFSLDGGATWQAVGAVNTNAALLLRDTDRIRFVPSGAANGQATITFRAWDLSTGVAGTTANAGTAGGTSAFSTSSETAALNVVESTGGPVAVADTAQTQVGAAVPIAVLSNDLDPQGDPLTVLDVSNPANGSLSLGGGGTVTYTPNGGFSGTDGFSYLARDGNDGLAHYWKLDGSATDSVGAANGTLVNGPATVAGVYGSALQFDGVNDHVALPDLSYSNEFTLSFRFRVDSNTGNQIQYFYSHGAVPTAGLRNAVHVGLVEDNNAVVVQRNQLITTVFDGNDATDASGQLLVDVAALIGDGQWHQYTATVTPGIGTQVYVDGVLRGSVNRGGDAIDPAGSALLAARSDLEPTRYLNGGGRMDSLALFNRALSSTEVAAFYSGGTQQTNVTVNVNATPVVVASGGSAGYTENGAPVVLDAGLLVSDANSTQLAGATVSISSNYVLGQDSLQFTNQLGITGSWNVGTGELVLSGNASVANYQAALRSVSYANSSEAPDTTARVLSFVVDDGLVSSVAATRSLVVAAVNDAPTASGLNVAEVYTEDTALNLAGIVASDVDNATGSVTLTLSNPAAGVLSTGSSGAVTASFNAGTGVWTASGALVDVNALLAALSFTPALNFNAAFSIGTSVSDGVAAPVTGSKAFTGVPVNDAPTASGLNTAETYTEDTPLNLAAIVASDVDNATLTVTLTLSDAAAGALSTGSSGVVTSTYGSGSGVWTASGAVADVNALLAGLVFTPATNYISGFSISTSVSDGLAAPVTGNKTVGVVLVNDAPTASNLNAAETTPEDTALDLTDTVVADVDNASLAVTLTLSNPGAGALSTGSAGAVTASYDAGTGVWAASGAVADVNSLLAALVFTPAPDFNGSLNIGTSVSDGTAAPVTGSKTVVVVPVNDAPTASGLNTAESYTEDTPLNLGAIVVGDIDSSSASVTLTLSNPAAGELATGSSGAVTSSFNATTGVWSASGAIANVNSLLAALVFTPSADFNGSFSVATSVSDGLAAALSGSKAFTGVPVNDAPTASNLNTAQTYTEDQALNLAAIVAGDIDSANVTARLTLSNTSAGLLSTGTAGAVASQFSAATGVWQASGALADVNALLAALVFQPSADFNAAFSIATSVSDGVAAPITGLWSMTGTPVNDAPTASGLNTAETYTEDTALNLGDIVVSDIDSSSASVTLTLSSPSVGTLATGTSGAVTSSFSAATGVWSASGAIADINTLLAAVQFLPALNVNSGFSIATWVSDGVAAPLLGSKLVSGVAVNDAPVLNTLGGLAVAEGSLTPLGPAQLQAFDVDNTSTELAYTLLRAPVHGSLLNQGQVLAVGGSFTQADLDAGRVAYRHDGSETTADALDFSLGDGQATGASGRIAVAVTPVNDEVPRITSPLAGVTVPENTTAVALVTATDADLPPQTLRFDIAGGADAAAFTVDAGTGALSFIAAPDFELPLDSDGNNVYQVDLRVSDGELASVSSITVTVAPVNDNTPRLTSSGGAGQALLEVQEGNEAVVNLSAADADEPPAALVYSIVGGADASRFVVNAASGALRFVDAPLTIDPRDRDADNLYQVVVQASDGSRLVQQVLSIKVRAAVSAGASNVPATVQTPQAPSPYSAAPVQAGAVAPVAVALAAAPAWRPVEAALAEEPAMEPLQNRRTALARLSEDLVLRSREPAQPQGAAAAGLGEGAGPGLGAEPLLPGQDAGSLEAALGLPGTDAHFLQLRTDGFSLAGLAAQTVARSSTVVPGPVTPAQPLGDAGDGAADNETIVQALAAPVVAGGMALSASLLMWATRAGGLAAAMMASVPAWRSLDPLPILARDRSREAGEGGEGDEGGGLGDGRGDDLDGGAGPSAEATSRNRPARTGPVDPPFDAPDDPVPAPPAQRRPPPAALRELLEPLETMR